MAKLKSSRMNQTVVLLVVCAASAMFGFALRANRVVTAKSRPPFSQRIDTKGQVSPLQRSDEKVIEIYERPDELVEFGDLRLKNLKIASGHKFSAGSLSEGGEGQVDDWLENLHFSFKNKSDKPIAYILLELQFPDTEVNGPLMGYRQLGIGMNPKALVDKSNSAEPLALNPGDRTTFTISAEDLQRMKDFLALRKFKFSEINKVVVNILYVILADGMKWSSGHYYRPNPSSPGGYERINQ